MLCTATQPDFSTQKDPFGKTLLEGFDGIHEIVANPQQLGVQLKRVRIEMPAPNTTQSWEEIAGQISTEECVLAIVNTRRHARDLYSLLPDDGNNFHLSALMCAEHRTEVLDEIRGRLEARRQGDIRPLRVVSTQLIEAGVDVDFPVVYRAMAGLDSIAQSAGRCNREGKLPYGRVVVFNPPDNAPPGFLRQAKEVTELLLKTGALTDPLAPDSFCQFFQQLNNRGDRDKHGINKLLLPEQDPETGAIALQFRTAAKKFRLIDNSGITVIVPFLPKGNTESPVEMWLNTLENNPAEKWVYKRLQRYTITLPESVAINYQKAGVLENRAGQFYLLEAYYDPILGVRPPDSLLAAEASIVC